MLSPKRTKHRKQMKSARHLRGVETRGTTLVFGDFGLRALEPAWITNKQIEAGRIALNREVKRGGKTWIRIFPDKPLTSKPAEVRMGKGKGSPEEWVAEVRAGRIIFEMVGAKEDVARKALSLAAQKLPIRCAIVQRSEFLV